MHECMYLTLDEIVDLSKQVRNFYPRTTKGWEGYINRKGWGRLWGRYCRTIDGKPAYHICLLPEELRPLAPAPKLGMNFVVQREASRQAARKVIWDAIERYRVKPEGILSRQAAVDAFIQSVGKAHKTANSEAYHHIRIEGFRLQYDILATAKGWTNAKGPWKISRGTLYRWKAELSEGSAATQRTPIHNKAKAEREISASEAKIMRARKALSGLSDMTFDHIVTENELRIIPSDLRSDSFFRVPDLVEL